MAWFRPMGVDEVAYHQATVVGRGDDHEGAALAYYGSRGETPLRWGGAGAARLGLVGEITPNAYEAAFGPGGFRDPTTGDRLVGSRRPGFELVVGAHKSVALLGVLGHAEAMHSILDAETTATMAALDDWFQHRGGRRGREQERTATGGLVYATTRHATSRAGDPAAHDHVLVANVVEMLDDLGGFKGLDSAGLRDTVEAATMVGRLHAAARAVELGFSIESDDGPSGNLRHWRIGSVPQSVCDLFSKRTDEIAEHLAESGHRGFHARAIAARATRTAKRHTGVDELMPGWHAELEAASYPVPVLARRIGPQLSPGATPGLAPGLTPDQLGRLASDVLDVDGPLLRNHKVFSRTNLIAQLAPRLYGHDPRELERAVEHILSSGELVPLIETGPVREQAFTTRSVLEAERAIATVADQLVQRPGTPVRTMRVEQAIFDKETAIGRELSGGQRQLVRAVCADAGSLTLVVGVAGSGKTTALDAAAAALQHAGRQVIGVSTSGQAARTLSSEAHIPASTFASFAHRLGRGTEPLGPDTVVIVDEAGMADDADLARLFLAAERTGARLVLVGDHRQLPAVGPGGGFAALLARHPDRVVTLDANVRQHDIDERLALAALRNGNPALAIDWYQGNDRIRTSASRTDTLVAAASAWAADVAGGRDTVLLAWRRADVTDLNRLARDRWDQLGRLHGPDITVANGRTYAVGDRVVATAPNHPAGIVTSERLTITDLSQHHIDAVNENGAAVHITGFGLDHEHLDHGYAVTIHRAQGVTADIAHVVADGGSRELAYVALSRARERSTIHLTAPDAADAAELLTEAWTSSHVEPWITDTAAKVGIHPKPWYAEREEDVAALLEQLRTYEPSVAASSPPLDLGIDFW